jgi:hypothetical protein
MASKAAGIVAVVLPTLVNELAEHGEVVLALSARRGLWLVSARRHPRPRC